MKWIQYLAQEQDTSICLICFSSRTPFSNLASARRMFFAFHYPLENGAFEKEAVLPVMGCWFASVVPLEEKILLFVKSLAHVPKRQLPLEFIISARNVTSQWFYLLRNWVFKKLSKKVCFLTQLILNTTFCIFWKCL